MSSKMGYWKTKVLPTIKKVFENKSSVKKAAAADACKSFDESKETYDKEFEEKKAEYQAKVLELYEGCSAELKALIKEKKQSALKKYSSAVHKFLEELAKIDFPGSKPVSEASGKYGAAYVPGPVFYVFDKVSTYIPVEKVEEAAPAEPTPAKAEEETSSSKEKEIVIEEEKKEEVVEVKKEEEVAAVEEKKEEPEACVEEKPKVEEPAAPASEEPAKP